MEIVITAHVQNVVVLRPERSCARVLGQPLLFMLLIINALKGTLGALTMPLLQFASSALQADRQIVMAAVREYGGALDSASEELQASREVVLSAIQQDGDALGVASMKLRADRGVVLAAVRQNGTALSYASHMLQGDREVVLTAMRVTWGEIENTLFRYGVDRRHPLKFASAQRQGDREVVLKAMMYDEDALQFASDDLQLDTAFVSEAMSLVCRA